MNLSVDGLKEEILKIDKSDIDIFHLDLMDGTFVPNFGMSVREIDLVRKYTQKPIDCHMMVMNPGRYVEMMAAHGVNIVYIHPESELIPSETLDKIHKLGMKAGIVLNPCTSISQILPLLPQCEYVMMMGVNPGFAGRDFMDYLYTIIIFPRVFRQHCAGKMFVRESLRLRKTMPQESLNSVQISW